MRDALHARGVTDVTLEPGKSGQFDILVDDNLAYSRYATGRFPTDQDIARLGAS